MALGYTRVLGAQFTQKWRLWGKVSRQPPPQETRRGYQGGRACPARVGAEIIRVLESHRAQIVLDSYALNKCVPLLPLGQHSSDSFFNSSLTSGVMSYSLLISLSTRRPCGRNSEATLH